MQGLSYLDDFEWHSFRIYRFQVQFRRHRGVNTLVFSRMSPTRVMEQEEECTLKTEAEPEPEPEPEPDSDCRLYLSCFRPFLLSACPVWPLWMTFFPSSVFPSSTLFLVLSGPTTCLFLDHGNIHNIQHGNFSP